MSNKEKSDPAILFATFNKSPEMAHGNLAEKSIEKKRPKPAPDNPRGKDSEPDTPHVINLRSFLD